MNFVLLTLRLKKNVLIDQTTKDYLLVMQYANDGDLQSYLNHFNHLTYNNNKKISISNCRWIKSFT